MKRYEYKILTKIFGVEDKLNTLGSQGWELIAVTSNDAVFYLKRELKD